MDHRGYTRKSTHRFQYIRTGKVKADEPEFLIAERGPVSRPAIRRGFDPPERVLLPGEPSTQQVIDELRGGA